MDHAGLRGLVGGGSDLGGGSSDVVTGQALDEGLEAGADDLVVLSATVGLADALLVSFDVGHVSQ